MVAKSAIPTSPLVGEDSKPREAKPSGSARLVRGQATDTESATLKRQKIGTGYYEEDRAVGRKRYAYLSHCRERRKLLSLGQDQAQ